MDELLGETDDENGSSLLGSDSELLGERGGGIGRDLLLFHKELLGLLGESDGENGCDMLESDHKFFDVSESEDESHLLRIDNILFGSNSFRNDRQVSGDSHGMNPGPTRSNWWRNPSTRSRQEQREFAMNEDWGTLIPEQRDRTGGFPLPNLVHLTQFNQRIEAK